MSINLKTIRDILSGIKKTGLGLLKLGRDKSANILPTNVIEELAQTMVEHEQCML